MNLKQLKDRLLSGSRFKQNFIRVAQANVLSQVLLLACTPILTRLYTPDDFGVLAVFASLLSITGAVCTWRFNMAVPNSLSLSVSSSLIVSGSIFLVAYSMLVFGVLWIHPPVLDYWKGTETLGQLIFFLPFALLFTGFRQLLQAWFIRISDMGPVSQARMYYAIAYLVVCITLGALGYTAIGLVSGNVVALFVVVVVLKRQSRDLTGYVVMLTYRRVFAPARKVLGFVSQASAISFANMVSLSTSVVLLAQVYGPADLGQYSLMSSLVIVPITTITQALALSFWSRAAELARDTKFAQLFKIYKKLLMVLLMLCIPVAIVCSLGEYYLVPILGAQWTDSHEVLIALIPMIVGITMFSATNHLFVLKLQRYQLIGDCTRIVLMLVAINYAGSHEWEFAKAVFAMSISSFIGHFLLFVSHLVAYRRLIKQQ